VLVGGRGCAGLEMIFLDRDIHPECTFLWTTNFVSNKMNFV
jgi:hypothetical protein